MSTIIFLIQDEAPIGNSLDFGCMEDLPVVQETIGADLVDNSELDQYLRPYPSTSSGNWTDQEQYYHARYHELQPNAAKQNFPVCQASYQPSYQYVINNFN